MALSYNLGYQESISVHPTRRQNFAGKVYSIFPNIWEWVVSSRKWNNLHSALKYWRPKKYSEEPHVKFWPFTLKIFSQPLDKIKLFFKQRKIIKIKFRSIWSILKAFTASRNLDIYKNNVLFRKAPLEGSDSNLWKGFTWLLLLFFSYVFKAPDLCFDMVLPRIYNYNLINI